jgi:hypothetical protein
MGLPSYMRSVVDRHVVMTLPIDSDSILNLDPSQLCNGEASRLLWRRGWILKFFRKVPGLQRITDLDLTLCRMLSMSEYISCALRKQADSATLAETLKSESSGRHYQLQRLTTRLYPLPCQKPTYEPLQLYCQFRYNNVKFAFLWDLTLLKIALLV